jgi:hypothetical protein
VGVFSPPLVLLLELLGFVVVVVVGLVVGLAVVIVVVVVDCEVVTVVVDLESSKQLKSMLVIKIIAKIRHDNLRTILFPIKTPISLFFPNIL